jgi:hypothetical protein
VVITGNTINGNMEDGKTQRLTGIVLAFVLLFQLGIRCAASEENSETIAGASITIGDPLNRFIERCAMEGCIPIGQTLVRPIYRADALRSMKAISHNLEKLNPLLRADYEYFAATLDYKYWHAAKRQDSGWDIVLDPVITGRIDAGKHKTILRRSIGAQFYGSGVDNRFGYYFRFVDNTERGNAPYTQRSNLLEDKWGYVGPLQGGKETYYDQTEAYLTAGWRYVDVTFGKDHVAWGPGLNDNLLLSGNSPSFDQLRLRVKPSNVLILNYLVGRLHSWPEIVDSMYQTSEGWMRFALEPKWLAAHRLDYFPREWLDLSISEAIVWGERGLDPAYLNPLNFMYSAQHDNGDRDNVMMSADFSARLWNSGKLYGSLLIDDLKTSMIGKGWAGNKLGWQFGLWWSKTGINDMDILLEYARLEPYVYSHFFPVNKYSTWNSSLGLNMPPNSDRFGTTVTYRPIRNLAFKLSLDHLRHGTLGGDIDNPIPAQGSGKVYFLSGQQTEWNKTRFSISWEPKPAVIIEAGVIAGDKFSFMPDREYLSAGYCLQ